jgi:Xaa-Pro aminopeptidase
MPNRPVSTLVPVFLAVWMIAVPVLAEDAPRATSSPTGIAPEEYRARRQALMTQLREAEAGANALRSAVGRAEGNGTTEPGAVGVVAVLVGAGEPGEDVKFRQENDFLYLTGVDTPHAALVLWPETGDEALYVPPRNPIRERFDGPMPGPGAESAAELGIARVESSSQFLADLFRAIGDPRTGGRARAATVYALEPDPRPDSSSKSARLARFLREGAPSARFKDLAPRLHEMRKQKSDAEMALLRRAIAVTADAHGEVTRLIRPGIPEYRLEGAILGAFTAGGASRAGFGSIVGSGPNSTVLHYHRNDRTIEEGDLVVVDIGGEFKNYTADITRTYPASGRFTPRQREIYQLVLDAQTGAAAQCKPGESKISDLNRWVIDFFRKSPLRARDLDGAEHTMEHFFVHGLGHQLGLDVHDVGDNSRPLAVGEVFTIEPGIYIPLEKIGVRIEDDYRVIPGGLEKLSKAIPCEPDEIERKLAETRGVSAGAR